MARAMAKYMAALLGNYLQLRFFDEPAAVGGNELRRRNHARAPWLVVMEWQKA